MTQLPLMATLAELIKIDEICGRKVILIPLKDWGYAPVDRLLPVKEDYKEWVLVIEENGKTWLWDSCIMEA
tara:strand:+ start:2018 stop:2230 length:213 start_codon:yes stop_codon:yes gene_type:complete